MKVRIVKSEAAEEDVGEVDVIMLPSVNYEVFVVRRIERRRDGRQFDELRACPDDADDLQGTTFHFV